MQITFIKGPFMKWSRAKFFRKVLQKEYHRTGVYHMNNFILDIQLSIIYSKHVHKILTLSSLKLTLNKKENLKIFDKRSDSNLELAATVNSSLQVHIMTQIIVLFSWNAFRVNRLLPILNVFWHHSTQFHSNHLDSQLRYHFQEDTQLKSVKRSENIMLEEVPP